MQDHAIDGRLGALHHTAEVLAQRRQEYGPPAEHFKQVARRWSLTLGITLRPEQVVLCLLDLKVARLAHRKGHHLDSLVDLIGYSVVLSELVHDASAEEPAEVAELADHKGTGAAAAEVPLRSAEARKSAG